MTTAHWVTAAVGIVGMLVVINVVVLALERRLAWPYVETDDEVPQTPYVSETVAVAQQSNFQARGVRRDAKGPRYCIRYEFWLSPDTRTLAVIGGGRLALIPVDGTCLYTRLGNGRCIVTIDDARANEYDLSGLYDQRVYPAVGFEALVRRHEERVAAAGAEALPYSERDPLSDYRELLMRKLMRLVHSGRARFLEQSQGVWRYTVRGAATVMLRAYGVPVGPPHAG